MKAPLCPVCGERDYSEWGDMPCLCYHPWNQQRQDEPAMEIKDQCAAQGHPLHGRDDAGYRCYCGETRFSDAEAAEIEQARAGVAP